MHNLARCLLIATCVLVLSCVHAGNRGASSAAPEIIVKYSDRHTMADTVVRAFDDAAAAETLSQGVASLSKELGVPFAYSRLTSGREIILELQIEQTLRIIAERCRASEQIAAAVIDDKNNIVVIDIDRDQDGDLDDFLTHTINDDRLPATGTVRRNGRVEVAPDFDRIARILVDELSSRPYIDYAQINYRVSHYD